MFGVSSNIESSFLNKILQIYKLHKEYYKSS